MTGQGLERFLLPSVFARVRRRRSCARVLLAAPSPSLLLRRPTLTDSLPAAYPPKSQSPLRAHAHTHSSAAICRRSSPRSTARSWRARRRSLRRARRQQR